MDVAVATAADSADWAEMRQALWPRPQGRLDEHRRDIADWLAAPGDSITFIVRAGDGRAIGFAEAGLRHDYVNGTSSSPVGFLEGIYVAPDCRRTGVARLLVRAVEDWVRQQGCTELASDTAIHNLTSQVMHRALGFVETQRVVYFRKSVA